MAYNNMGHAFFLEDGGEENNVFRGNLAIFTKSSSSLLNVDVTPGKIFYYYKIHCKQVRSYFIELTVNRCIVFVMLIIAQMNIFIILFCYENKTWFY